MAGRSRHHRPGPAGRSTRALRAAAATPRTTPARQTRTVAAGHSIQQAVDAAHPGDTILVRAGTYRENLTITVPDLTLRGESTDRVILRPPAVKAATATGCAGTGICVTGTAGSRLTGVHIADLTVTGFATYGIAATETDGMTVRAVHAEGNGQYGIGQQKSVRGRIVGNVADDNGEAGVFLANTVDEEGGALDLQGAVVAGNTLSGNKTGVVLRRVRDAAVDGNTVTGNCAGMFIVGDEGVPRAGHLSVRGNSVTANTRYCAANTRLPFVQGAGIVLTGVEDTVVERNTVTGNTGTSTMSGGVVFFHSFVGVPNTDNTVQGNVLLDNGPADVTGWDAGTGNSVTGNACRVSQPAGRC
ncbi:MULTISPECIES: right-handed parallel beta-helix repeat-containing protein [unclassified Streptomyces]|uniref:right-handed parallel beta-helix repeat-containing protein n=1 Tax=unclassified Streptomyces TaxID=2593676 RepID=UPI001F21F0B3|nr:MULTISPECIES: right-handed parallel beta-helix repeat-containing protein [unclassified Streptomyces]